MGDIMVGQSQKRSPYKPFALSVALACLLGIAVLLGVGPTREANAVDPEYTLKDLGTLPGYSHTSEARAVNDKGQVVGVSEDADGVSRAFLYDENATPKMQNLGTLPGGSESEAWDINEKGQVVGESYNANSQPRAVLWENAQIKDLGTLPGSNQSYAYAINEKGQVAGSSRVSGTKVYAFLYDENATTKMKSLGSLGEGTYSHADGIDDNGRVVGEAKNAGGMSWPSSTKIMR